MSGEKKFDLGIALDEGVVKDLIAKAVANSLGNADTIVETIVRSAFDAKDPASYGSKTLWQSTVEKLILERAQEVFREWLRDNDTRLREAFRKRLDRDKAKVIESVVDAVQTGAGRIYVSHMGIEIRNG